MRVCINNRLNCFALFTVLGILLFSCGKSKTKNTIIAESPIVEEMTEKLEKTVIEPNFNLQHFKFQLDSLLSTFERKNFQFQLNIDTISENTNPEILWHFGQWGLFKIVCPKVTSQLILYHFFDPKTSKILRIYLIEATYNDSIIFTNVYQSFLREKDINITFMVDDGDGDEYYIPYSGLTALNDFVIILDNKIYWLNVSLQYSKKNLNKIICYFKDNLSGKNYIDTIRVTHD
jgi:hypothetical protein